MLYFVLAMINFFMAAVNFYFYFGVSGTALNLVAAIFALIAGFFILAAAD